MRSFQVVIALTLASVACLDLGSVDTEPSATGTDASASDASVEGSQSTGCDAGQQPGPNGGCVASCGGLACGTHETCNPAATPASCACVAGYARGAPGGACVFNGGPADPGFQNSPPSWQVEPVDGGATIRATDDGGVDPGALVFNGGCTPGLAKQSFPMPAYSSAEPLALELMARSATAPMAVDVVIAGRTFPTLVPTSATFQPIRICLGESAYGTDVELIFRRTNQCGEWAVDRATVVPDATCLTPGALVSADFQSPGWVASNGAETTTSGLNGLSGRLPSPNPCIVPALTGKIHVPASMARPALAISYKGTAGVRAELALSGGRFSFASGIQAPNAPFGMVIGSGAFERVNVCLPDWARGTIRALQVSLPPRGADCSLTSNEEFIFDDLAVIEDSQCEDPGLVFDPGFERGALSAKVVYAHGSNFDTLGLSGQYYKLNGAGSLPVKGTFPNCSTTFSSAQSALLFASAPRSPPGATTGAPRVSFAYRTIGTSSSFAGAGQPLGESPGGGPGSACLPRSAAGQGIAIDFTVTTGCPYAGASSLIIDDVALSWDPACP